MGKIIAPSRVQIRPIAETTPVPLQARLPKRVAQEHRIAQTSRQKTAPQKSAPQKSARRKPPREEDPVSAPTPQPLPPLMELAAVAPSLVPDWFSKRGPEQDEPRIECAPEALRPKAAREQRAADRQGTVQAPRAPARVAASTPVAAPNPGLAPNVNLQLVTGGAVKPRAVLAPGRFASARAEAVVPTHVRQANSRVPIVQPQRDTLPTALKAPRRLAAVPIQTLAAPGFAASAPAMPKLHSTSPVVSLTEADALVFAPRRAEETPVTEEHCRNPMRTTAVRKESVHRPDARAGQRMDPAPPPAPVAHRSIETRSAAPQMEATSTLLATVGPRIEPQALVETPARARLADPRVTAPSAQEAVSMPTVLTGIDMQPMSAVFAPQTPLAPARGEFRAEPPHVAPRTPNGDWQPLETQADALSPAPLWTSTAENVRLTMQQNEPDMLEPAPAKQKQPPVSQRQRAADALTRPAAPTLDADEIVAKPLTRPTQAARSADAVAGRAAPAAGHPGAPVPSGQPVLLKPARQGTSALLSQWLLKREVALSNLMIQTKIWMWSAHRSGEAAQRVAGAVRSMGRNPLRLIEPRLLAREDERPLKQRLGQSPPARLGGVARSERVLPASQMLARRAGGVARLDSPAGAGHGVSHWLAAREAEFKAVLSRTLSRTVRADQTGVKAAASLGHPLARGLRAPAPAPASRDVASRIKVAAVAAARTPLSKSTTLFNRAALWLKGSSSGLSPRETQTLAVSKPASTRLRKGTLVDASRSRSVSEALPAKPHTPMSDRLLMPAMASEPGAPASRSAESLPKAVPPSQQRISKSGRQLARSSQSAEPLAPSSESAHVPTAGVLTPMVGAGTVIRPAMLGGQSLAGAPAIGGEQSSPGVAVSASLPTSSALPSADSEAGEAEVASLVPSHAPDGHGQPHGAGAEVALNVSPALVSPAREARAEPAMDCTSDPAVVLAMAPVIEPAFEPVAEARSELVAEPVAEAKKAPAEDSLLETPVDQGAAVARAAVRRFVLHRLKFPPSLALWGLSVQPLTEAKPVQAKPTADAHKSSVRRAPASAVASQETTSGTHKPSAESPSITYRFTRWGVAHSVNLTRTTGEDGRLAYVLQPSNDLVSHRLAAHFAMAPAQVRFAGEERSASDQSGRGPDEDAAEDDEA